MTGRGVGSIEGVGECVVFNHRAANGIDKPWHTGSRAIETDGWPELAVLKFIVRDLSSGHVTRIARTAGDINTCALIDPVMVNGVTLYMRSICTSIKSPIAQVYRSTARNIHMRILKREAIPDDLDGLVVTWRVWTN